MMLAIFSFETDGPQKRIRSMPRIYLSAVKCFNKFTYDEKFAAMRKVAKIIPIFKNEN